MHRDILQDLERWKEEPFRKPLLIRGARQVGKSYAVMAFAEKHFEHVVVINFEFEPHYKSCFETLDPAKIIVLLTALTGTPILEGKTLLFLDEIQSCPRALQALRYFKEKLPALHVIAAGSLVEFALHREAISMPVGRIEYAYMHPCSFREYLDNSGHQSLRTFLDQVTIEEGIPEAIHQTLLTLFHEYMMIGGMPEAMHQYLKSPDISAVQRIQTSLLATYRDDFGKYANLKEQVYLDMVFQKTPSLVGQQVMYSKLAPEQRSRDLKQAISTLEMAGVVRRIFATTASGLPLRATLQEKKFKMIFLDVGLIQCASHLDADVLLSRDLLQLNQGALAEQVVAQELLAYASPFVSPEIFYWSRDQKNAQAEVDYLIQSGATIVPIEVKSSANGHLKSLKWLMEERALPLGVKISTAPMSLNQSILSWPIYMIWRLQSELKRLLK